MSGITRDKERHREKVVREMNSSINLAKDLSASKILLSQTKNKLGHSGPEVHRRVRRLMEDILNVNFNNRAEIFKFMLDKVSQNRSYFLCGFDLFHINNFNSNFVDDRLKINIAENHAGKKRLRIQEAVRWLSKPYTVQPESANVFSFVAFLVKNNAISKKRQVALIRGPKASGKSTQLSQVLDFFRFLGKVKFLEPETGPLETRSKKHSQGLALFDDLATGGGRNRAISANKQPRVISRLEEETLKIKVLNLKASSAEERGFVNDACLSQLTRGLKGLQILTSSIGPDGRRTSNATISMRLKLEEGTKQCLLRRGQFGVNFFLTAAFENKRLGGFESFYGFLEATDATFLNAYGLKKEVQANAGLYFDRSLKPKFAVLAKMWCDFEDGLPKKLRRAVQKTMCAMLMLLNLKNEQVSKETEFLSLLLEVDKDSMSNYFKVDRDLGTRDKARLVKVKARRAAEILYRALVDSVVGYFNLEMRELCESTQIEGEVIDKFDLEFIDFLGYQDHQMEGTAGRPRDNGKYEFVCNWLNEKLFKFYTQKKFQESDSKGKVPSQPEPADLRDDQPPSDPARGSPDSPRLEPAQARSPTKPDVRISEKSSPLETERERRTALETEQSFQYVKNDDIISQIEGPQGVFALMKGLDFESACGRVGEQFTMFLKKTMQFLNHSGVRETSLKGEEYYLDFQHFFAEAVNYDLRSVFELSLPQSKDYEFFWKEVFLRSRLFLNFEHWEVEQVLESRLVRLKLEYGFRPQGWRKELCYGTVMSMIQTDSEVDDALFEWGRFLSGLDNIQDLYFINCLRIGKVDSPKKVERELYKTFDGLDLESLIEFYKASFPIRFSYDYFHRKFGLHSVLASLLGLEKSPEDGRQLAEISRQVLELILPQKGAYVLGNSELRVKQEFLAEIETQLHRLNDNQSLRTIMQRLVITAFRAKMRKRHGKAFEIAEFVLRQKTKRPLWDVVQEARAKFMSPVYRLRDRLDEAFITERYHSMADKLVQQALAEELHQNLRVIQRYWRKALQIKAAKRELEMLRNRKRAEERRRRLSDLKQGFYVLRGHLRSRQLKGFVRQRRRLFERIQRLFRRVLLGRRLAERILERKKLKLKARMEAIQEEFVKGFLERLKYKQRMRRAPVEYKDKWANAVAVLPKMNLSLQQAKQVQLRTATLGLFLTKVQEAADVSCFRDNLAKALNHLTQDNDAVLKIHIQKETSLIQTAKQRLYLFSNTSPDHLGVTLPSKAHFIYYVEEFLYFVDESLELRIKHLPLSPKTHHRLGSKEAVFEFAGFQQLKIRERLFIGLTTCDKLCLKADVLDESRSIRIIQFRRKLTRVDCGHDFTVCLDEKGVLFAGGNNAYGQLGLGHRRAIEGLVPVEDLSYRKAIVKAFSCGKRHVLAVTANNQLFAWGDNSLGQVNPLFSENPVYSGSGPEAQDRLIVDRPIKVFESLDFVPKGEHRIQVRAGKTSSFVLSSDAKLFCFGSPSDFQLNQRVVQWDLRQVYGPDFWPVSLEVEWSPRVELVYFRFINGGAQMLGNTPLMRSLHRALFESFMSSGGSALLRFSKLPSKYLHVRFMSSKLAELANHRQNQRLLQHKHKTWNYIMLAKNHPQRTHNQS